MQRSDSPALIPLPFANTGSKRSVPTLAASTVAANQPSLELGFPTVTMIPKTAGGIPPAGPDFNGVFNLLSSANRWDQAGGLYSYNSSFSTSIGGYPKGALLLSTDGVRIWQSSVENNATDPDGGSAAGWVDISSGSSVKAVDTIAALRACLKTGRTQVQTLGYYAAADGGGSLYRLDLTDTSSSDNGGTVIVATDGGRWKMIVGAAMDIRQFGVRFDNLTSSATANSSQWASALYALPGATFCTPVFGTCYISSPLNLIGWFGRIIGASMTGTVIKASAPMYQVVNINESSDTQISPVVLENFTIDGNSLVTAGYNIRYRHHTVFNNLLIQSCVIPGIEKDAWLSRRNNIRYSGGTTGLWLQGSNHSSHWNSCTFTSATTVQILVQSNGSALDGNSALKFTSCDVEFASGGGVDLNCTDVTFDTCYLGENIGGAVLTNRGGSVSIRGGTLFFGYTTSSYAVNPQGGRLTVDGSAVNGQTYGGASMLVGPGGGSGKTSFRNIVGAISIGGDIVLPGDVLDYGPQGTVYANRLGRSYSVVGNNVTASAVSTGNELKATATAAPGPTPLISVYCPTILPTQWRAGEPLYLAVVYASTKQVNAYLSNSALAGNNLLGFLPATSGVQKTYIKLDANATTTAYGYLEFILQSVAVGDYVTIYEAVLADSRMLAAGPANLGNLYKC